jgi:hypothetical protein
MKFRTTILQRGVGADCGAAYFSFIRKTVVHSKDVSIACKPLREYWYCLKRGIDNHNQYLYFKSITACWHIVLYR